MDKLVVEHLNKAFGETGVLHDVSFTVRDGEFLSILGPSGCGKTTILRILIGLEEADSGRILKDGEDITKLPSARRGMGIVFQNYALFENMTVLQNVSYALLRSGQTKGQYDKASAAEKAREMLEVVGLGEQAEKKPAALSGARGGKQPAGARGKGTGRCGSEGFPAA